MINEVDNVTPSTKLSNLNHLDTKFNALKPNIPHSSKAVSTELSEKFNSDIRTTFKNQTLKQVYLTEVMGNIQYSFSIDQLEKLEDVHPNRTSKYNTDLKISINLIYLTGCVLKRARRKSI